MLDWLLTLNVTLDAVGAWQTLVTLALLVLYRLAYHQIHTLAAYLDSPALTCDASSPAFAMGTFLTLVRGSDSLEQGNLAGLSWHQDGVGEKSGCWGFRHWILKLDLRRQT